MGTRAASGILVALAGLAVFYYLIEPWAVTFVDDGPYHSRAYPGPVDELPLQSAVELKRFGRLVYVIESRILTASAESVLC